MNNEKIKKAIQDVTQKLGFEVESISEEMDEVSSIRLFKVRILDGESLIGRDGQGFQAFNYLVSKIVQKEDPEIDRFTVDINGHYQKSIEVIKRKAGFAADRARSYKVDIEMDPMNSFERLIVHSMFPEGGDIKTHSTGEGVNRRVVLSYTGD